MVHISVIEISVLVLLSIDIPVEAFLNHLLLLVTLTHKPQMSFSLTTKCFQICYIYTARPVKSGKNAKIFAVLVEDRGNCFYVPCWTQAGSNNPCAGCGPEATRMAPALGNEQGTAIHSNTAPFLEQVFTLQKNRLTSEESAHKSGFILKSLINFCQSYSFRLLRCLRSLR